MSYYKHTQIGTVILVSLGIFLFFIVWYGLAGGEAVWLYTGLLLFAICLLFASLTSSVDNQYVRLYFGVGIIRRKILLTNIKSVEIVKTPWYFGYGIRYTTWGWMWNVSGTSGVQLNYQNGKHFRIGTNDPEGLVRAIEQTKKQTH